MDRHSAQDRSGDRQKVTTDTAPTETTTAGTGTGPRTDREPGFARSLKEQSDAEIDNNFRHIVCVLCYPAFRGTRQAPQDAVCICGKRLRAGDNPAPASAPQCILCNELADNHFAVAHDDDN